MKHFEEPNIELLKFNVEDVLTTSSVGGPNDENAGEEQPFPTSVDITG